MGRTGKERWQEAFFSAAVVGCSRLMVARDRLLGKIDGRPADGVSRHRIANGTEGLDAVLILPEGEARAAVLICHGIGETVEHWPRAQALLARSGVASLVFNYSGMGRSTGRFSAAQCERDAVAADAWLRERLPGVPVTLLGFSLGSGVAAAVVMEIAVERLVLCEAYTSFRDAARRMGLRGRLACALPDIWRNVERLRGCRVPVLVVHGARDRLFPVTMGEALAATCGARLEVVAGMGHADLHERPRAEDLNRIADWVLDRSR